MENRYLCGVKGLVISVGIAPEPPYVVLVEGLDRRMSCLVDVGPSDERSRILIGESIVD